MGAEQSTLRFLLPNDPPDHDHPPNSEGVGTSSNSSPSEVEDVPSRMNSDPFTFHHHYQEDNNAVFKCCPYIDNNDNRGSLDSEFISVEYISNCQEESEIQLEDSSIDNNSNTPEEIKS
ncbi:hypothetical protein CAEBREN_02788 [Caenorhabditis brenneri]|uniref:Uncharacterized protein n=1 Tax=Caenorhabditis brenneri TaxID=135651 RepID=G0NDP6_CAEBE|nr:hypothetical protein CAEBREN_02788 [Caenorhabditis brenneri]